VISTLKIPHTYFVQIMHAKLLRRIMNNFRPFIAYFLSSYVASLMKSSSLKTGAWKATNRRTWELSWFCSLFFLKECVSSVMIIGAHTLIIVISYCMHWILLYCFILFVSFNIYFIICMWYNMNFLVPILLWVSKFGYNIKSCALQNSPPNSWKPCVVMHLKVTSMYLKLSEWSLPTLLWAILQKLSLNTSFLKNQWLIDLIDSCHSRQTFYN